MKVGRTLWLGLLAACLGALAVVLFSFSTQPSTSTPAITITTATTKAQTTTPPSQTTQQIVVTPAAGVVATTESPPTAPPPPKQQAVDATNPPRKKSGGVFSTYTDLICEGYQRRGAGAGSSSSSSSPLLQSVDAILATAIPSSTRADASTSSGGGRRFNSAQPPLSSLLGYKGREPDPNLSPSFHAKHYYMYMRRDWHDEYESNNNKGRPVDAVVPRKHILKTFRDFGCYTDHYVTAATPYARAAPEDPVVVVRPKEAKRFAQRAPPVPPCSPPPLSAFFDGSATNGASSSSGGGSAAAAAPSSSSPTPTPTIYGVGLRSDSVVICTLLDGFGMFGLRQGMCVDSLRGSPIDLASSALGPYSRQSDSWSLNDIAADSLPRLRMILNTAFRALQEAAVEYPEVEDMIQLADGTWTGGVPTVLVENNNNKSNDSGKANTNDGEGSVRVPLSNPGVAQELFEVFPLQTAVYTLPANEEAFWCMHEFRDMPAQVVTQLGNCLGHFYGSGLMHRNVTLVLPRCPRDNPHNCVRMMDGFVKIVLSYLPIPNQRVLFLYPHDILIGRVHFAPGMHSEGAPPCALFFQREYLVPAVQQRFRSAAKGYRFVVPPRKGESATVAPTTTANNGNETTSPSSSSPSGPVVFPYKIAMLKTKSGGFSDRQFHLDDKAYALLAATNFTFIGDTLPFDERIFLVNEAKYVMANSGATHSVLTRMYGPRVTLKTLYGPAVATAALAAAGLDAAAIEAAGSTALVAGRRTDPLKVLLMYVQGYDYEWHMYCVNPPRHVSRSFHQDGMEIAVSNGTTWNYDGVWEKAVRTKSRDFANITANHIRFPPCERYMDATSGPPAGCSNLEEEQG